MFLLKSWQLHSLLEIVLEETNSITEATFWHLFGVGPETGGELQMVNTFSFRIFWLGILKYLQDVSFISEIFCLGMPKQSYHSHPN